MSNSSRKRKKRGGSAMLIGIVLVCFLIGITFAILQERNKDEACTRRVQELQAEMEEETQRATEIDALEEYMKSTEYVEDTAKNKLGLAYDNEIIFKESED